MKWYVVMSRMPVMVEWPLSGEVKSFPRGSVFQANERNTSVQKLLRDRNKIREAAPHEIDDEPIVWLED